MRKRFILFALIFAWFGKDGQAQNPRPSAAGSAGCVQVHSSTGNTISCGGSTVVASLPSASANANAIYLVHDGTSSSDCTAGGGTSQSLCVSNGSAWVALGGGGGGGGGTIPATTSTLKGDGAGNAAAVTGTGSNCVHVDGTSASCSGVAGASQALDNLSAVNINTSLLAQTGVDAGSTAKPFRNIFLFGAGTFGSTYIELTGTPTGNRVWTFQDTTDTVVGRATTDTLSNKTLASGTIATTQSQNDNSIKLATTAYTDLAVANAVAGINPAVAVAAASTANVTGTYSNGVAGVGATFTVTATGAFTLDGVSIGTIGQRVLLKNQTSAFQNGIYTATVVGSLGVSPIFTRALDYDTPSNINSTGAIPVQGGTVNTTTSWLLTSTVTTIGTDALTYVQFSLNPANQVQTTRTISTTSPLTGGGDLSADRTFACATCTVTICSGTIALQTSAVGSASHAETTATCTGAASTDTVQATFNGSPLAVTGFVPATAGMLGLIVWPTANTINVSQVNNTASSITPGAITLNFRVVR